MTKYAILVELVKDKGWKNISQFTRDIRLNGTQSQAIRRDEFSDKVIEKICEALDYTAEELADALGEDVAKVSQEVAKPVTFEAVAEALPEVPALAKADPGPVEAPAPEPCKPDFIVEDYDNAPDDSALEAEICETINEDLKSDSFTPTAECDLTIVYISNLQAEADKQNNYDDNMFRWLQANKPEIITEYEAWLKQTKNKQVIGTIEADMKDLWDVYNSDAPYETRMKALDEMEIAIKARKKLYKEELTNGN